MFLFHGFYDHMGLYRHVVDWALDQGFVVIACDLPGHGLSSGERASIDDFAVYQRVVQALFAQAAGAATCRNPGTCSGKAPAARSWWTICSTRRRQPGPGQGASAVAAGAAACLGLVEAQLLPAAGRSSKALRGVSVRTPTTRRSSRSWKPTRCSRAQLPTAWVGALARWIKRIEAAPRSPRRPVIVQGEEDMTVDWRHNLQVLRGKFDQPEC